MSQAQAEDTLNLLDGLDIEIPGASGAGPSTNAAPASTALGEGSFFGTYQLIQEVGAGGVARVLRARHIHPGYAQTFAIKILHDELSRDPKVVSLFRHEAYVLSMLKHPNIVQTFEGGVQDDKLFIAMEYIDGRDLEKVLARCKRTKVPIPIPIAMYIIGEVLKGLMYAHDLCDGDGNRLALLHRDLNPANVFLSYDGRVKLGDFGVASIAAGRVEKSRELAGKVGYFAPEQLDGEDVDQRADLFALGVMMFEILCGERLFDGEDMDQVLKQNRKAKIPKPSKLNAEILEGLEAVMLKALERKPADRFPNARAMYAALRPFVPDPAGMPLAVAALIRKVFLAEHIQELQLREGLSGQSASRGAGQVIAVVSHDERAQVAFNELLTSRGYKVEVFTSVIALAAALESQLVPHVIVCDTAIPGLDPLRFAEALAKLPARPPVVAVSEDLSGTWIRLADAVGAVDLLFKPFNIERVLTSVRSAVTGAANVAPVEHVDGEQPPGIQAKVLFLSSDKALVERCTRVLGERGYSIHPEYSIDAALECTNHGSFDVVIYDASPATPADRLFAAQLRGRPAMGIVPVLYLAAPVELDCFAGVDADRCAARSRTDAPILMLDSLVRLMNDTRLGRTFVRYTTQLPVELRYGGRTFEAVAVDVSRGGIMVRCAQMPPVGEEVNATLRLPGASGAVEVTGRVTRVDLPKSEGERPGIGISFDRFAGRAETDYIRYIMTLDKGVPRRQTVILGAPPPAR